MSTVFVLVAGLSLFLMALSAVAARRGEYFALELDLLVIWAAVPIGGVFLNVTVRTLWWVTAGLLAWSMLNSVLWAWRWKRGSSGAPARLDGAVAYWRHLFLVGVVISLAGALLFFLVDSMVGALILSPGFFLVFQAPTWAWLANVQEDLWRWPRPQRR